MTFSLHQTRGSHVRSDNITHIQSSNIHSIAHILDTCPLIFSSCALLTVSASRPCPGTNHQSMGGRSERTPGQAKNGLVKLIQLHICTRALRSFLSLAHCRAASTVIPLLPKATFTPSIHPALPRSTSHPPSNCFRYLHSSGHPVLVHSFHIPKPSEYSFNTLNTISIISGIGT